MYTCTENKDETLNQHEILNIVSLNVCGIISKLKCPDFIQWIYKYDIICLQETKTDETDVIEIPGYTIYMYNRQKLSRYRSGGIALLVKNEISQFISVDTRSQSSLIKLFSISKDIYGSQNKDVNEDLLCGIVYIPPQGSRYSHTDPYFELQNELLRYCTGSKHILLLGDFNSRCGDLTDYLYIDEWFCDMFDLESMQIEEAEIYRNFELHNIQLNRNNVDSTRNHYGKQLIDFCKSNYLFIWNGRIGCDAENPNLTCKNASTIDYFLSTSYVFENVLDFQVEQFCDLFSDAHCCITARIKTKSISCRPTTNEKDQTKNTSNLTKTWDRNKANIFLENLNIDKVHEIDEKLNYYLESQICTQNNIDTITEDIASLFDTCSRKSFGMRRENTGDYNNPKNRLTPWFDRKCNEIRNKYHKTRKAYNKYKTQELKGLLKSISKEYKSTLRRAHNKFKTQNIEKLKSLKSKDPKLYWKQINLNEKKSEPSAKLHDLYQFFKNLNENNPNIDQENDIPDNNGTGTFSDEELNGPISEEEILKTIKMLMNNKVPGADNIINEQLKNSVPTMLTVYVKLFNIIFDTGIIPKSWSEGIIKPIYKQKGKPTDPENYRPISLLSCFGKLFTCIINNRLNSLADKYNVIHETQAGFRKNHSTIDNIFVLKSLIDIVQSGKKKMYCCFVDFKQAFDSVWRAGLWTKLREENINGKCFTVINNLYKDIKSRVSTPEGISPQFSCLVGVRQWENLSPFLFFNISK